MARQSAKGKAKSGLLDAFKLSTGTGAANVQEDDQPKATVAKRGAIREFGAGVADVGRVLPAMGADMFGKLGQWWKTGEWEDAPEPEAPKKEKTEAKKKDKSVAGKESRDPDSLKKLLASNLSQQSVLEKILSEISLLRKTTESGQKDRKRAPRDMGNLSRFMNAPISPSVSKPQSARTALFDAKGDAMKGEIADIEAKEKEQLQKQALEAQAEGSGPGLTDLIPGMPGKGTTVGKAPVPGGAAAGGGFLGKAARFMGGKGGVIAAGITGAIGGGLYAYDKFTEAKETEEAAKEQAREDLAAGKISSADYNKQVQLAQDKATITKSEGVGGGLGRMGGAMAGAKAGAMIGTAFGGPIGTVAGGLIGGAVGYFGGGKLGEWLGGKAGEALTGSETAKPSNLSSQGSFSVSGSEGKVEGMHKDGKYYINGQEVSEKDYQAVREKYGVGQSPAAASLQSGKPLSFDDMLRAGKSSSNIQPVSAAPTGAALQQLSVVNKEMAASPAAPTIINNNTTTAAPGGGQPGGIIPLKPSVRPEASSLTRYLDRVSAY